MDFFEIILQWPNFAAKSFLRYGGLQIRCAITVACGIYNMLSTVAQVRVLQLFLADGTIHSQYETVPADKGGVHKILIIQITNFTDARAA